MKPFKTNNKSQFILKFIPLDGSSPKEVKFSKLGLSIIVFIFLMLILGSGVLWLSFVRGRLDQRELARLRSENRELRGRLFSMEKKMDTLRQRIDMLLDENLSLKLMAGLVDSTVLRVAGKNEQESSLNGVGGPAKIASEDAIERELDRLLEITEREQQFLTLAEQKIKAKLDLFNHTPTITPAAGVWTSGFGIRRDPFTGKFKFHEGLDIAGPVGTPIFAPADGIVSFVGWKHGYGLVLKINHGNGIETVFAHLHRTLVNVGQKVHRGQKIALMGNTGRSTGPHLHYEVRVHGRPQNPEKFIIPDAVFYD